MLRSFKKRLGGVIYSPDGKTLATVAEDNSTYLFDVATGKLRHELLGQLPAFSPDGIEIVTRDERVPSDQAFYFWDVKTGKQRHALKERDKWRSGCVIAADEKTLITGRDRTVQWCDRATGKEIRQVRRSPSPPTPLPRSSGGEGRRTTVNRSDPLFSIAVLSPIPA